VAELFTYVFLVIGFVVVLFAAVIEGFCVLFAVVQSGNWCVKQLQSQSSRIAPRLDKRPIKEELLRAVDSPESRLRPAPHTPPQRLLRPETDQTSVNGSIGKLLMIGGKPDDRSP